MKKFLLLMMTMTLVLGAKAEGEVVFDFDKNATALFGIEGRSSGSNDTYVADGEFKTDGVATLDGVTITVTASPEDAQTKNRLWATSPVLRMYNGTLTVEAPDNDVTKIVFSAGSNFNIGEVSSGKLEGKTWTADGAVSGVVFTITKNTQLKSMTVYLDGNQGEPVVIAGTGEGTETSPYDIERAVSLIQNDMVTSTKVYVKGSISEITEVSLRYGNATYTLAQGETTLKVYRGYYYKGEKFTAEDLIKVGDELVVYGELVTGYGGQITTGSSIYSINGVKAPEEPEYVPVGDGTKANPYTVTDIQKLNILDPDGKEYWVKGVILGSAASATKLNDAEKAVDTNVALGETAASSTFIPVAIPVGDLRGIVGVATNPENVGKEVMVYGTLEKYFSTAGVKNVTACVLGGEEYSGIEDVTVVPTQVKYYNIQGVEVSNPVSGQLYIRVQGGKAVKVIK